jgi:hypothetical protein
MYMSCTSLNGIVSVACYCAPLITRVFSLQACILAALVVRSKSMLWQYCSLRAAQPLFAYFVKVVFADKSTDERSAIGVLVLI